MKKKSILVTGGAGFIGSHLADALIHKFRVIVLDNFSSGKHENLREFISKGGEVCVGDILNYKNVEKLVSQVDVIIHLAVQCVRLSFKNPHFVHETNITGTLNLLEAARKKRLMRFLYVSSSEVYGNSKQKRLREVDVTNPSTIYGASKLAGEYYCRAYLQSYNLPIVIVRPFNTYGPRSHFEGVYGEVIPKFFIRLINKKRPIIYGNGYQTRDFTYISDTVNGLILALDNTEVIGEVINIAHGVEVSINELAELISGITRKNNLLPIYSQNRPADILHLKANIQKARKLLNFNPQVSINKGLQKYYDWLMSSKIDFNNAFKQDEQENWK